MKLQVGDWFTEENVIVCKNDLLLSWKSHKSLKIIPNDFPRQINHVKNIDQMKIYLLKEFQDVFNTEENLKTMHGKLMKIHLKEDAVPHAIHVARPVPKAWEKDVEKSLDKIIQQGIISPFNDEPSEWCHPMVIGQKQNSGVRMC